VRNTHFERREMRKKSVYRSIERALGSLQLQLKRRGEEVPGKRGRKYIRSRGGEKGGTIWHGRGGGPIGTSDTGRMCQGR